MRVPSTVGRHAVLSSHALEKSEKLTVIAWMANQEARRLPPIFSNRIINFVDWAGNNKIHSSNSPYMHDPVPILVHVPVCAMRYMYMRLQIVTHA